jgi:hypothetical protein
MAHLSTDPGLGPDAAGRRSSRPSSGCPARCPTTSCSWAGARRSEVVFRENGTRGTDHGHGSVHWVLGGAVLGGAVRGGRRVSEQVAVTAQTLNQNRDFPVLTNYRGLIGGLLKRLYSLDANRLAQVFPESAPVELGLI